jgi:hypothetical protein
MVQYSVQLLGQFWMQFNTVAQKMIKSGGIPCLRVQAGRIGPIEAVFKGSYGVPRLIETSRFRGKGCLSVLYSPDRLCLILIFREVMKYYEQINFTCYCFMSCIASRKLQG